MYQPLSIHEVRSFAPTAWVGKYSQLSHLKTLRLPMIVLYEVEPNYGHWVAILETPEGIEHFDSYGILPDNELQWVPVEFRHESGQDVKHLLRMMYATGKKINYNSHRLQGKDTSTCGRWAALRIMFSFLGTNAFYHMVKSVSASLGMTPDEMVSIAIS